MNAWPAGVANGFRAAIDVFHRGARQPGDDGILCSPSDFGDSFKIAIGGDREAGLDDVDAHAVQQVGDRQLLVERHRSTRALFAIAQCRIKDQNAIF